MAAADGVVKVVIRSNGTALPDSHGLISATDGDAITAILGAANIVAEVAATEATYHNLVQFHSSDWDFVLARAAANGLVVITGDQGVTVKAPATATEPVLCVTDGIDLISFEGDIDARPQFAEVSSISCDPATQEVAQQQATPVDLGLQGNLDANTPAKVGGIATLRLQTAVPLATSALTVPGATMTLAGNTVVMSEDAKSIVMTDQHGNKVALDDKGILLDSPFDVVLKAGGKITLDAGANIEATAADLQQSAQDISSKASMSLVAKGASSAELSASGQLTVKGALVAIN
jgi:hypothetical protein